MKKKIKSAIYSFSILASLFLAPEAKAKISPKAFKNIARYFKEGMEFYSPVLGEAALEGGLIHDLRFYGNFESALKEGKRLYIKDKSKDPLWTLVKNLFPSPAGHLVVETTTENNFGHLVTSPQTIALLLNYAKDVRAGKQYTPRAETELRDEMVKSFNKAGLPRKDQIEAIRPILNAIKESIQGEKESPYPAYMTEQVITAFFCEKFTTQSDIWRLLAHLDDDIVDKSMALPTQEDLLTGDDLQIIAQKPQAYSLDDIYALANGGIFTALTPYKPGASLLSNGNTHPYDRKQTSSLTIKLLVIVRKWLYGICLTCFFLIVNQKTLT